MNDISAKRLAEIAAIPEDSIDLSDIPELDETFFRTARLVMPAKSKTSVSLRVDQDVLDFFKSEGKGHLSRMNAVLRAYMLSQTATGTDTPKT